MTEHTPDAEAHKPGVVMAPCCGCEKPINVCVHSDRNRVNIVLLSKRHPRGVETGGWSCLVCKLPAEGAVAVLCDACVKAGVDARFAVDGKIEAQGRLPVEGLEAFEHDQSIDHDDFFVERRRVVDQDELRRLVVEMHDLIAKALQARGYGKEGKTIHCALMLSDVALRKVAYGSTAGAAGLVRLAEQVQIHVKKDLQRRAN